MIEDEYHLTEAWKPDMGWRPPHFLVQCLWIVVGSLNTIRSIESNTLLSQNELEAIKISTYLRLDRIKTQFVNELNGVWMGDSKAADKWLSFFDNNHQKLSDFNEALEWILG